MHKNFNKFGWLGLVICFVMNACAVQDAHRSYTDAQALVREASKKAGSADPTVSKAFDALNSGRLQLLDARYDLAMRNFREAKTLSREVLARSDVAVESPAAAIAPAPVVVPPVEEIHPIDIPVPPAPEVVAPEIHFSSESANKAEKKALPKKAVQKYLAGKSAPAKKPAVSKTAEKIAPKTGAEKSAVVAVPGAEAEATAEAAPSSEPEVVGTPLPEDAEKTLTADQMNRPEEQKVSAPKIVVAPAEPSLKPVPKSSGEPKAQDFGAIEEDVKKSLSGSKKRQVPGSIMFIANDPTILTEAMSPLNQIGKFLLENPSTTLVLKGQLTSQEARSLLDARFDSIRAYLTGKGVPEDQIQLDSESKRGKSPEFTMFLIEH